MSRFVIKIAGESGTGIESSGVIVMKALKKMGYWLTADREFPSLIKGGVANYQINFSDKPIKSMSTVHDVGVAVDREGIKSCLQTLKPGGLLIHGFERWQRALGGMEKEAKEKKIEIIYVPASTIAKENGGSNLMVNVVILGTLWKVLKFDLNLLEDEVRRQFGKKATLLDINLKCIESGYNFINEDVSRLHHPNNLENDFSFVQGVDEKANLTSLDKLKPNPENNNKTILIDGNTALTLGAIHAGVRAYYAYPMSPASSILTYFAKSAFATKIVVKQAEDEITASQMALGSMHVGVRSFTATSGGGFDLMTETVSLSGMIETPLVIVIAQRPGPATGLPTWTGQADLNLAIYSAHGEFAKIVMACTNPSTAFDTIQHAFNLAESFQCPTILLTEKTIGESKVIVPDFKQNTIPITRGLITDPVELANLKRTDRYEITESGVSKRWLPGSSTTTYFANGDEHHEDGSINETEGAGDMIAKRIRKLEAIKQSLPEPEIFGDPTGADISFVGWGSSQNAVLDAMEMLDVTPQPHCQGEPGSLPVKTMSSSPELSTNANTPDNSENKPVKINYLHFTYLWPLKTDKLIEFFQQNSNVHLIEGNATGQLGQLIAKETDLKFVGKLLKYNGRPFYVEDVANYIKNNT